MLREIIGHLVCHPSPNSIVDVILCVTLLRTQSLTDFESRHALCQNVYLSGCYFHLASSVWKRVQKLRLVRLYFDDENVRLFVRMAAALSCLPLNDVPGGYEL